MGDTTRLLGGWRGLVSTALDSLAKDNHLIISVESDERGATNPPSSSNVLSGVTS